MARCIRLIVMGGLAAHLALATGARAADNPTPDERAHASGTVIIQSGAPPGVPVGGTTPSLTLSAAQHARIQEVLAAKHTAVSLNVKENEGAKSFEPKIGATIPKGLDGEAFPQPLISEIPETKRFTYLKFKDQVLIVNPLTRKIVDMFAGTKG